MFESGEYEMQYHDALSPVWITYEWRISDEVLEVKNKEDPTAEWKVLSNFPAGAYFRDTD